MECVEQAEQVEQENPSECAQRHIGLLDNRPNSFHVFHLFHSPCGTEQVKRVSINVYARNARLSYFRSSRGFPVLFVGHHWNRTDSSSQDRCPYTRLSVPDAA